MCVKMKFAFGRIVFAARDPNRAGVQSLVRTANETTDPSATAAMIDGSPEGLTLSCESSNSPTKTKVNLPRWRCVRADSLCAIATHCPVGAFEGIMKITFTKSRALREYRANRNKWTGIVQLSVNQFQAIPRAYLTDISYTGSRRVVSVRDLTEAKAGAR